MSRCAEYSNLTRDEFHASGVHLSWITSRSPRPTSYIDVHARRTPQLLRSADRLVVDAELTSKILEAKRLRKENGGRWPAAIPGIETSHFPGASWRYEASPDGGGMSICVQPRVGLPYKAGQVSSSALLLELTPSPSRP